MPWMVCVFSLDWIGCFMRHRMHYILCGRSPDQALVWKEALCKIGRRRHYTVSPTTCKQPSAAPLRPRRLFQKQSTLVTDPGIYRTLFLRRCNKVPNPHQIRGQKLWQFISVNNSETPGLPAACPRPSYLNAPDLLHVQSVADTNI